MSTSMIGSNLFTPVFGADEPDAFGDDETGGGTSLGDGEGIASSSSDGFDLDLFGAPAFTDPDRESANTPLGRPDGEGLFDGDSSFAGTGDVAFFGWPFGSENDSPSGSGNDVPFGPPAPPTDGITQERLDGLTSEQRDDINETITRTPTFLYHGFTVEGHDRIATLDRQGYDVDIGEFEKNVRFMLDEGYSLVTTRDVIASEINGTPLPEKIAIIRIDDGDQTTALAVDVVRRIKAEPQYEDRPIKLELGINAGTVGDPGDYAPAYGVDGDGKYDVAVSTEEGGAGKGDYEEAAIDVKYRKVTWNELGDWVGDDLVELSNHGLVHTVQDDTATGKQIRDDILVGESELEREMSAQLGGADYQVPTYIWPRGENDRETSVEAFDDSGHVVGLGTDNQAYTAIPNVNGGFERYFDSVVEDVETPREEWEIHDLPAITVITETPEDPAEIFD